MGRARRPAVSEAGVVGRGRGAVVGARVDLGDRLAPVGAVGAQGDVHARRVELPGVARLGLILRVGRGGEDAGDDVRGDGLGVVVLAHVFVPFFPSSDVGV